MSINVKRLKKRAKGRWADIISDLAPHLKEAIKTAPSHVPCPVHGGKDGFRMFDDYKSSGE